MRKRTSTLFRFHQISCKHINHIYENLISEKNTIVLLAFFHEWINNVLLWKRIGIPASLRISIIFKVLIENYISIFDKSTSRVGKRRNFIYNNCFFNEKMGKFMKFSIFEIIELLPRDWNTLKGCWFCNVFGHSEESNHWNIVGFVYFEGNLVNFDKLIF